MTALTQLMRPRPAWLSDGVTVENCMVQQGEPLGYCGGLQLSAPGLCCQGAGRKLSLKYDHENITLRAIMWWLPGRQCPSMYACARWWSTTQADSCAFEMNDRFSHKYPGKRQARWRPFGPGSAGRRLLRYNDVADIPEQTRTVA